MTVYFWIAPLLVLLYAIPVALAVQRARARQATQDVLRAEAGAALPGAGLHRVRLLRGETEGSGWLAADDQSVQLLGRFADGTRLEQRLLRAALVPAWVGRAADGLPAFTLDPAGPRIVADGLNPWNVAPATAALYRELAPDSTPPDNVFHLQSHPLSLAATIAFVLLAGYAVLDGFLNPFVLVGPHGWVGIVALALIPAGLLAYPLFRRTRLPPREALLLPLLLSLAASFAATPLIKRIDAASATAEPAEATYFLDGAGVFKPMQAEFPVIHVRNIDDYWAQMPPGMEQRFLMHRGGLGLWQLETEWLRRQVHSWYQSQSKPTPRLAVD